MVIMGALNEANLGPNEMTGLEMHGTGTALGDPIEIGAAMGVVKGDMRFPSPQSEVCVDHLAKVQL